MWMPSVTIASLQFLYCTKINYFPLPPGPQVRWQSLSRPCPRAGWTGPSAPHPLLPVFQSTTLSPDPLGWLDAVGFPCDPTLPSPQGSQVSEKQKTCCPSAQRPTAIAHSTPEKDHITCGPTGSGCPPTSGYYRIPTVSLGHAHNFLYSLITTSLFCTQGLYVC